MGIPRLRIPIRGAPSLERWVVPTRGVTHPRYVVHSENSRGVPNDNSYLHWRYFVYVQCDWEQLLPYYTVKSLDVPCLPGILLAILFSGALRLVTSVSFILENNVNQSEWELISTFRAIKHRNLGSDLGGGRGAILTMSIFYDTEYLFDKQEHIGLELLRRFPPTVFIRSKPNFNRTLHNMVHHVHQCSIKFWLLLC